MDLGWISLFCGTRKGHYKASDPFSFSAMNNVLKLPMSNSLLRMPRSLSASTMGRHGMRHPWSASLWDCWNWRWNSARTGFGSCCNVSGFGVKRDIDGHSKLPNASQNRRQQWILKQYSAFSIKALGLKSDSGNPPNCPKLRSRTPWTHRFVSPTRCSLGGERPFWIFWFTAVILQEHQWISAFDFGTTGMMVRSCIISSAEFFIVFRIVYQQMHQSQPLRAPQHDEDSNIQELVERLRILEESVMSSHQEAESPGSSQCFQKWWLAVQNKLLRRVLLIGVLEPELLKLSLDLSYFCRSSNVNDLISLDFSLFRFSGLFWYLQGKRLQPALLLCSEGEVSNHDEMTWNVLTCVLWIVNFCMWFSA